MKGSGFTFEQVAMLVLVLIVLGVLVTYLMTSGQSGLDEMKLRQEKASYCTQYVEMDNNCNGDKEEWVDDDVFDETKNEIVNICSKLGYSTCQSEDDIQCIKTCCSTQCT